MAKKRLFWASLATRAVTVLFTAHALSCSIDAASGYYSAEQTLETLEFFGDGKWCVNVTPVVSLADNQFEAAWKSVVCTSGRWLDENLCASSGKTINRLCPTAYESSWIQKTEAERAIQLGKIKAKLRTIGGIEVTRPFQEDWLNTFPLENKESIIQHRRHIKGLTLRGKDLDWDDFVNSSITPPHLCTRERSGKLVCDQAYAASIWNPSISAYGLTASGVSDPSYNCHGYVLHRLFPNDPCWRQHAYAPLWISTSSGDPFLKFKFQRIRTLAIDFNQLIQRHGSIQKVAQLSLPAPEGLAQNLQDRDVLAFYRSPDFKVDSLQHSALVQKPNACNDVTVASKIAEGPIVEHGVNGITKLMLMFRAYYVALYRPSK